MSTGESTLHYETLSGRHLVVLNPSLADAPWTDVEAAGGRVLQLIREDTEPGVLVDLTELSYISSTMVALVVRIWKSINSVGGRMVVVNSHPIVEEVLQIAGLLKVWEVVDSREQGLELLGQPRQEQIERRESYVVAVVAPLMAIVAFCCCVMYWVMPTVLADSVWATLILGNATIAAILGVLCIAKYKGRFRVLGGLTVVVAVGTILMSQFFDPAGLRAALRNALADPDENEVFDAGAPDAHAETSHDETFSHDQGASHAESPEHAESSSDDATPKDSGDATDSNATSPDSSTEPVGTTENALNDDLE